MIKTDLSHCDPSQQSLNITSSSNVIVKILCHTVTGSYVEQSSNLSDFCKKLRTFNLINVKSSCKLITVYLRALFILLFYF